MEQRRLNEESAAASRPGDVEPGAIVAPADCWSFGGGSAIVAAEGTLSPRVLLVDARQATLHASLVPSGTFQAGSLRPRPSLVSRLPFGINVFGDPRPPWPTLRDLSIVDDQGASYVLRLGSAGGPIRPTGRSQVVRGPMEMWLVLEPIPDAEVRWLEIRNKRGSASRLVPSPSVSAHVNRMTAASGSPADRELLELAHRLIHLRLLSLFDQSGRNLLTRWVTAALARIAEMRGGLSVSSELADDVVRLADSLIACRPANGLPASWSRLLNTQHESDGRRFHLDARIYLPPLDGVVLRLDSVISEPNMWWVYIRPEPSLGPEDSDVTPWPEQSLFAEAQDDLGGTYVSMFGRGSREELALRFLPRLNPLAQGVKLTFRLSSQEVSVDLSFVSPTSPGYS